ncbi:hypothetical protein LG634_08770 [Streptomyces bambusae]|uniref:hypothetical protein n=1 Tax=Streptomyces bambusae TaxID=1550616 RepID=UPI001CFC5AE0|nr:hypothetical protein [Streptomyces bambusae]MCB5164920.1 hypothetical protein [Streptomyces bambusae]
MPRHTPMRHTLPVLFSSALLATSSVLLTAPGAAAVTAPVTELVLDADPGLPKTGIALSRGVLRVAEDHPSLETDRTSVWQLSLSPSGSLSASERMAGWDTGALCPVASVNCSPLWGNAGFGGDVAHDQVSMDGKPVDRLKTLDSREGVSFGVGSGGSVVDVSDGYAIFNSGGTSPSQYVARFGTGTVLERSVRAAALNGHTVWSTTPTAGRLELYGLASHTTRTWDTGAPCVPQELQARGR